MMHAPAQPGRGGSRRGPMGGGTMAGMMKGENARDFKGTMIKLIAYLGQYKLAVIVVFIFAIASTIANIAGPKLLGNVTTLLFTGVMAQLGGAGSIDFNTIGQIVILTIGLYLMSAMFAYLQGWIMADVSTNIAYRFRRDIS
jgi:ATP-binding cassette subfamily B protein